MKDTANQTVDQAGDALLEAVRRSDVATVTALTSEWLTFSMPDGAVMGRHADLETHCIGAARLATMAEVNRSTMEHQGRARTKSLLEVQMQRDGQHEHATFAGDLYWAIVDGHWQVVAGSITSVETP